jgi:DNA (cytosine-5)-methyltransferase 1
MKAIDLFSGCGGLSLGLENAGYEVLAAFDNWKPTLKCYAENFGHPVLDCDLADSELVMSELKRLGITRSSVNIVVGGPPCQDFSHAGGRSEGERANLTVSFARIVMKVKPTWFLMENVDRARTSIAYSEGRELLKKAGYGLTEIVLNASRCGVPQNRKRFFCIGRVNETDGFLKAELEKNLSCEPTTIRDYFGTTLGIEYYYRHPRNYDRRGIFSIDEPAPTVRGVNRPVPKGYLGHPNDPVPKSDKLRPLTTQERAQVQTFPETFVLTGNKTENEQMIGNAVPVKLAEYVARTILKWERKRG